MVLAGEIVSHFKWRVKLIYKLLTKKIIGSEKRGNQYKFTNICCYSLTDFRYLKLELNLGFSSSKCIGKILIYWLREEINLFAFFCSMCFFLAVFCSWSWLTTLQECRCDISSHLLQQMHPASFSHLYYKVQKNKFGNQHRIPAIKNCIYWNYIPT